MKHALHFASKLNSRDFQICNCFWVPSYDLFASARKAVFPAPTTTGVHRLRNTWSSLWEVICHKKVQQSFLNQSLDSSNQKFLDPPPNCSPILWPSHSFVYLSIHDRETLAVRIVNSIRYSLWSNLQLVCTQLLTTSVHYQTSISSELKS